MIWRRVCGPWGVALAAPRAAATQAAVSRAHAYSTLAEAASVASEGSAAAESTMRAAHLEPRVPRRVVTAAQLSAHYPQQTRPALAAMRARLRLSPSAVSLEELASCADPASDASRFDSSATRGRELSRKAALEHLHARYPNMPAWLSERCVAELLAPGSRRLMTVAQRVGFQHVAAQEAQERLADMPLVFLSLLDSRFTTGAAESLVKTLIMPHRIDWEGLVAQEVAACDAASQTGDSTAAPIDVFSAQHIDPLVERYYGMAPDRRLLSESGRLSERPAFVVGLYAGTKKLGEGFGYSLAMAGREAEVATLLSIVLGRVPLQAMAISD